MTTRDEALQDRLQWTRRKAIKELGAKGIVLKCDYRLWRQIAWFWRMNAQFEVTPQHRVAMQEIASTILWVLRLYKAGEVYSLGVWERVLDRIDRFNCMSGYELLGNTV
jgi:hypothetical protein